MTEAEPDGQEFLAAEYVLGTLDAEERGRARDLLAMDPAFAATVRAWERRLGELNVLVAAVEPPAEIWDRIRAGIAGAAPREELRAPVVEAPPAPAQAIAEDRGSDLERLRRRVRRWRKLALLLFLIAAAGAAFGIVREMRPEYLPAELRPKLKTVEITKTVEIPSPKPAQFVAALEKEGSQPAFLLSFDLERRTLMVRNVSAPPQAGSWSAAW